MDADGRTGPGTIFAASSEIGSDGSITLHLAGEVDIATAPELRAALVDAMSACGAELLVDLSELRFCGAAGVGVFIDVSRSHGNDGKRLVLIGASGHIEKTLRLCNADWLLG